MAFEAWFLKISIVIRAIDIISGLVYAVSTVNSDPSLADKQGQLTHTTPSFGKVIHDVEMSPMPLQKKLWSE
jgi:hypothetical protein